MPLIKTGILLASFLKQTGELSLLELTFMALKQNSEVPLVGFVLIVRNRAKIFFNFLNFELWGFYKFTKEYFPVFHVLIIILRPSFLSINFKFNKA